MAGLLIIGASGGTGRLLVDLALAAGHQVRALARHPDILVRRHPRLEVVAGDALEGDRLRAALEGRDVVVSLVGVRAGLEAGDTCSRATANTIAAMEGMGIGRLMVVTAFGLGDSGRSAGLFSGAVEPLYLRSRRRDRERQEELVFRSRLAWTVVRPGRLCEAPATGRYRVGAGLREAPGQALPRADLASFLLEEAWRGRYVGQAPSILAAEAGSAGARLGEGWEDGAREPELVPGGGPDCEL